MSPGFYIHNVRYNPAGNPKHFPEANLAHSTGLPAGSRQRGDTSNIASGGGPASSKGVF